MTHPGTCCAVRTQAPPDYRLCDECQEAEDATVLQSNRSSEEYETLCPAHRDQPDVAQSSGDGRV